MHACLHVQGHACTCMHMHMLRHDSQCTFYSPGGAHSLSAAMGPRVVRIAAGGGTMGVQGRAVCDRTRGSTIASSIPSGKRRQRSDRHTRRMFCSRTGAGTDRPAACRHRRLCSKAWRHAPEWQVTDTQATQATQAMVPWLRGAGWMCAAAVRGRGVRGVRGGCTWVCQILWLRGRLGCAGRSVDVRGVCVQTCGRAACCSS